MLTGCSRGDADATASASTTRLTAAELPSSSVTFVDSQPLLTRRVEAAIAAEPLLSINARNVDVTVESGIATLRGSVNDIEYRRDVERAVAAVPGVVDTRNLIDVSLVRDLNDRESDDRIAFALQRSLTSLPSLGDEADGVSIEVVHGQVTLRGSASSRAARQEIEDLVEHTPGVTAVTNELTLEQ
jgi:osmotically-inducible protein OsmY